MRRLLFGGAEHNVYTDNNIVTNREGGYLLFENLPYNIGLTDYHNILAGMSCYALEIGQLHQRECLEKMSSY